MTAKEYYFGIKEELGRSDYVVSGLILPILLIALSGVISNMIYSDINLTGLIMSYTILVIAYVTSLWIFFAVVIKRMNQLQMKKVYLYLVLVPFIGFLFLIYLGIKKKV